MSTTAQLESVDQGEKEVTSDTGINDGLRTVVMAKIPEQQDQSQVKRLLIVLTAFIAKLSDRLYETQTRKPENEQEQRLADAVWCILQIAAKMGYYPLSKLLFGRDGRQVSNSYIQRVGGLRKRAEKDPDIARRIEAYDAVGNEGVSVFPEFSMWKDWLPGWVLEIVIVDALEYLRSHFNLRKTREETLQKFENTKHGEALLAAFASFQDGIRHRLTTTELLSLVNWEGKRRKVVAVGRVEHEFGELLRLNPTLKALMTARRDYLRLVTMLEKTTWRPLTWEGAKRFPFLSLDDFFVAATESGRSRFVLSGTTATIRVRTIEISNDDLNSFLRGEVNGNFCFTDKKHAVTVRLVPGSRLEHAAGDINSDCFMIPDPRSGAICEHCFKGLRFYRGKGGEDPRYEAKLTFQPKVVVNDAMTAVLEQLRKKETPTFAPGTLVATFSPTITDQFSGGDSGQVGWFMVHGAGEDGKPSELLYSTQVTPYIPLQKGASPKRGKRGFQLCELSRSGSRVVWLVLNPGKLARRGSVVIRVSEDAKARFYRASAANPLDQKTWKRVRVSGTFYAPTRGASISKLVQIRHEITVLQKLSQKGTVTKRDGTPRAKLEKGDFQKLWDKFSRDAKELRRTTAIQVLRLVLRASGVLRQQHPKQPGDDVLVATPKRIVGWQKKYGSQLPVLLVLPIPKGSAHQSWRSRPENRILHMFGPAGVLDGVIFKSELMGFPYATVSKSGIGKRCPACGTAAAKGSPSGELKFDCCDRGRKGWPRGVVLCLNLLHRLMNPAEKMKPDEDDE